MKSAIIRSVILGVFLALIYNLSKLWMGLDDNSYDYAFYAFLGIAGVIANLKFLKNKSL